MKSKTISFTSFNLCNLNEPGLPIYTDKNGWSQDEVQKKVAWTAEMLTEAQADVFGFQELWHYATLDRAFVEAGLSNDYVQLVPNDEMNRLRYCSSHSPHRHAIPKERVHSFIVAVQSSVAVVRFFPKRIDRRIDLLGCVAVAFEIRREQLFFDVAVAFTISPVAEVTIAKLVAEKRNDAILCFGFWFADEAHFSTSQRPAFVGPVCRTIPSDISFFR